MKNNRQDMILEIISEENVETQEHLLQLLEARGIASTQATISRDIKQLHLIKEPTGSGGYRYAISSHKVKLNFADKLRSIFRESVISVDYAQNIIVLKTMPGLANAAAAALDGMENSEIVGTLAGDDTVFLLLRDTAAAAEYSTELKENLR